MIDDTKDLRTALRVRMRAEQQFPTVVITKAELTSLLSHIDDLQETLKRMKKI